MRMREKAQMQMQLLYMPRGRQPFEARVQMSVVCL